MVSNSFRMYPSSCDEIDYCLLTEGRSLREFDEKLKSLRKENFNLKLRIFFLEERSTLGQNTSAVNLNLCSKPKEENVPRKNTDIMVNIPN